MPKSSLQRAFDGYETEAGGIDSRQLLEALLAMRAGDFSVRLTADCAGIAGELADAFNEIAAANQRLVKELQRASDVVGRRGKLRHRIKLGIRTGDWAKMENSVNALIADLVRPAREMTRAIEAVTRGDLQRTVRLEVGGRPLQGEFLRSAGVVNKMIRQLSVCTSDATRAAREVDHRARNALANVQAIMRLTKAETLEEYSNKIERRVHALTHTHELLSNARWKGADIRLLARDELAPYRQDRISMHGPSVILSPEKAQSVALTLNELATNAAQYGALSSAEGRVDVSWVFEHNLLKLDWLENGGPHVSVPQRTGFGMRVIQASLYAAKGDAVQFDWNPAGLRCRLRIHCGAAVTVEPGGAGTIEQQREPAGGRRRILVVEDEALVGMLTCDYLETLGYSAVGPFSDIDAAGVAIEAEAFDLALLDVCLAGKPIYPIAELLRSAGYPIVFVSGFSDYCIAPEFGAVEVVPKPIDRLALSAAIERTVGANSIGLKSTR